MLSALSINNFTTVDKLHLEVDTGFIAITGETGAGKSVMLEAINLTLGGRLSGDVQRDNNKAAELSASFSLNDPVCHWLNEKEIPYSVNEDLLLRRSIKTDGRSRAFINDTPVNLNLLKELSPLLVEQHSQHAHHALLDKKAHASLLDDYAGISNDVRELDNLAHHANSLSKQLQALQDSKQALNAKQQLLSYQLEELIELAPQENEAHRLETQLKQLSQVDSLQAALCTAKSICLDEDGDNQSLQTLKAMLAELRKQSDIQSDLKNVVELLDSALIQLEEAGNEIEHRLNNLDADPEKLSQIEQRLDQLYSVARKHQVDSNNLHLLKENLQSELESIDNADADAKSIAESIKKAVSDYSSLAQKVSKKRAAQAKKFEQAVNQKLAQLSMKHCAFKVSVEKIALEENKPARQTVLPQGGLDQIAFLISTIPGKPPAALNSVASGGELSRISLAIKVVAAATKGAGTLIFDEVDVGIGGGVAEIVGELIKALSEHRQVLCVTHLAQVASKADQHCLVSKDINKKSVSTTLRLLDTNERKRELARMMSGVDITEASLAQADKLMINSK